MAYHRIKERRPSKHNLFRLGAYDCAVLIADAALKDTIEAYVDDYGGVHLEVPGTHKTKLPDKWFVGTYAPGCFALRVAEDLQLRLKEIQ